MNVYLPSALKRFVAEEVRSGRYSDAGEVIRQSVRLMGDLGAARFDADIMALIQRVMMECAKTNAEDIKAIMATIKAINAAKQEWRKLLLRVHRDVATNDRIGADQRSLDFARGMGTERAYHNARVPRLDPDCPGGICFDRTDLYPRKIHGVGDLRIIAETIENQLDSLVDLTMEKQMRLQMYLEAYSRTASMISNIVKKLSETANTITSNIK